MGRTSRRDSVGAGCATGRPWLIRRSPLPGGKGPQDLRLSSPRLNNGGSGSFVSARGLLFSNHHVASGCIQKVSTAGHDYMRDGFYARTGPDVIQRPGVRGQNRQPLRRGHAVFRRAARVHAAGQGIVEALRNVCQATAPLDELLR
ncbi:MAG: S46 family peptidase [Bryobacteraceae bacterium]